MDDEWSAALNGLEAVWQRVMAQDTTPLQIPKTEETDTALVLRRFQTDETARAALYAASARLSRGETAEALKTLSNDCRRCFQMLRTEYYLLTGDDHAVRLPQTPGQGLLTGLRRAYLAEGAAAQAYAEAAFRTGNGQLRQIFADLAERCRARRERIRVLIRQTMK